MHTSADPGLAVGFSALSSSKTSSSLWLRCVSALLTGGGVGKKSSFWSSASSCSRVEDALPVLKEIGYMRLGTWQGATT
eukprot:6181149-Pleurochrysis_carterae.AAC.4